MQNRILKQLGTMNTPAYIFNTEKFKKRITDVREQLDKSSNAKLCYAMKANPFLVRIAMPYVDKVEVCSPGEMSICKSVQVPAEKIVLSGVNKEYLDVKEAMSYGVQVYTAESRKHLSIVQQCAAEANRNVNVLIRLSSGNQFGVDLAMVKELLKKRDEFPNLKICGIHYYSGTQKKAERIVQELESLNTIYQELTATYGVELERLEYGPGLPVDYFGKGLQGDEILEACTNALAIIDEKIEITIELGRYLAAECGNYVTKVVDVKYTNEKEYVIVDGGIHHVNYYGQVMGVRLPPIRYFKKGDEDYTEVTLGDRKLFKNPACICGSLCTTADVLVGEVPIKDVREGDMLLFEQIGAYSVTEGIYLFLSRKLPKIFLLEKDELRLVRDAYETYKWNCEQ